jgi:class 3 adenylate cyclase/predicted ATPase
MAGAVVSEDSKLRSLLPELSACPACGFENPVGFRFCGGCGVPLQGGTVLPKKTTTRLSAPERRQVTVLFCDLVGSTALANQLDLEEFRDVISSFQAACVAVIDEFKGTISRYMGDGMLVLFGFPRAHEDDAERAVRAGLGMVQAVAGLGAPFKGGAPLATRVGIATGLVVVGDLIGEGAAQEEAVLGEAPNLAARLHTLAAPNAVVVAASTRNLVGGHFAFEDLGLHDLKGFEAPVQVWRVAAARASDSRFQAARLAHLTPLVDRGDDLARLMDLWGCASQGRGHVALLAGEAGIGKSRLVEALRERIGVSSHRCLQYQCSPQFVNRALHPLIQHLENAAALSREEPQSSKLGKLSNWLTSITGNSEDLPLLAALLSIEVVDPGALADMSAPLQKKLTFELLTRLMRPRTTDDTVLVVFEDVHWADPTTQEFLSELVPFVAAKPVLVILTFRPDYKPPWNASHVRRCVLQRLPQEFAYGLVERVAGEARTMPRALIEQLVRKTDGIPLFLEELTRAVLGARPSDAHSSSGAPESEWPALSIPSTLQDSLMARLDQLGPAKYVAQLASTIGREFDYSLLEAISSLPQSALRQGLRALQHAGLVYAEPSATGESYAFKHALLQEAAYQTLLRNRRRELHARIAEVLEQQFAQITQDAPELVAHHWTAAGNASLGVLYWLAAGKRASARSEYAEAIGHLRRGIELISLIADPAERSRQELELLLTLGPALIVAEGAGTPEVARVYARALDLCRELPKSVLHFAAHWGWWRASMDHRSGRERADALLRLAEELGDSASLLQAHHGQWATLYMLGAHEECCRHVDAGLQAYDADDHRTHSTIYGGHDAKVCALGERALSFWLVGRVDEAVEQVRLAIEWADELSHVGSRVHALDYALVLHKFRRDAVEVSRWADMLLAYATEQHLRDHLAKGAFFRGWARALLDDAEGGIDEMRKALASEQDAGTPEDFPLYYEMLAEVCGRAGCHEEGLGAVADGFAHAERGGIVYWNAELHRRRGELLLALGRDHAEVADCFREAMTCARVQGARSLELRAAVSLARLHGVDGEPALAVSILRPVYEIFTQGFDTPDLVEARALLEMPA